MKRCTVCGKAVDDDSGMVGHASCPWCGGALDTDPAGARTLADALQVLWTVDPSLPYDAEAAESYLRDLCPQVPSAERDMRAAAETGALAYLREGKEPAATRALTEAAHWDNGSTTAFVAAYSTLRQDPSDEGDPTLAVDRNEAHVLGPDRDELERRLREDRERWSREMNERRAAENTNLNAAANNQQQQQPQRQDQNQQKNHGRKRIRVIVAAIIAVVVVAVITIVAVVAAPWEPTVEEFGCPNTNVYQESDYQMIEGKFEYFMDTDWNLYVVPFDTEANAFIVQNGTAVDDEAGSINLGKNKAYFIHDQHTEDGDHDSIMQMNFDGSNVEAIVNQDGIKLMQYVSLSNGDEYLYFTTRTDNNYSDKLYRYNINNGKTELIKEGVSWWFNMDGKYLYYVTFDGQNPYDYCALHRCLLNGKNDKVLDDEHGLVNGYIVDGNIYMASLVQEIMVKVDGEKKNSVEKVGGKHAHDIVSGTSVYGDGWFYYCPNGSTEIHRVMADGLEDTVIAQAGQHVLRLNYLNNWLFTVEGAYNEKDNTYTYSNSALISRDGSKSLSLGNQNMNGLSYVIVDGEAYIKDYTGEETHVSVPASINGYPLSLSDKYLESSLEGIALHLEISKDELSYKKTDGGIMITGYSPSKTKEVNNLAIPSQIDGQPVVAIGRNAFSNDGKVGDDAYSFTQMLIPDTVKSIQSKAFYKCVQLKYVIVSPDCTVSNGAFESSTTVLKTPASNK